jgi:hypothetical protein
LLQAAKFERNALENGANEIIAAVLCAESDEGALVPAASGAAFSHQKWEKEQVTSTRRCRPGDRGKRGQTFSWRQQVAKPLQALATGMQ